MIGEGKQAHVNEDIIKATNWYYANLSGPSGRVMRWVSARTRTGTTTLTGSRSSPGTTTVSRESTGGKDYAMGFAAADDN